MTIHKSQGSQADRVTVLLPDEGSRLLTRELFYTAVTRAQEHVRVVGTEAAVRAAVTRRATGLGAGGAAAGLTPIRLRIHATFLAAGSQTNRVSGAVGDRGGEGGEVAEPGELGLQELRAAAAAEHHDLLAGERRRAADVLAVERVEAGGLVDGEPGDLASGRPRCRAAPCRRGRPTRPTRSGR